VTDQANTKAAGRRATETVEADSGSEGNRHGPQLSSWGPFGDYGWRPAQARPEELSTGWLTGAGCVLRGADPSHRVNLGFVFLTCALSVFSGHLSVFSGQ
jgi:hypothetical protein